MKKTAILVTAAIGIVASLGSCSKKITTPVASSAAYSSFETQCLGVEHDGLGAKALPRAMP
ncbi:hypothetical protein [Duncaniella muris]|uniref:hypothetical protein n=1 Tax=Duncaniella muris TaxID=2094150 RepID=UPI002731F9BD|nr:hypothetical protein [Duncaniella muris]